MTIPTGSPLRIGVTSPFPSASISSATLPFINVKDYGALGDGVTDDTAAFLAAIATAAPVIYVPHGEYVITSTLTLTRAQMIVGALPTGGSADTGTNSSLLHNFNGDFIVFDGSAGNAFGAGGGLTNLQLFQTFGSGASGVGDAVKVYATNTARRGTWLRFENIQIEPPTGAQAPWTWGFELDGTLAGGVSEGIRDIYMRACRIAGVQVFNPASPAAGGGMKFIHTDNVFIDAFEINATGTFTDPGVYVAGSNVTDISSTLYISNTSLGGTLYCGDYSTRIDWNGGNLVNLTTTANSGSSVFRPAYLTGVMTVNGGPHVVIKTDGSGNLFLRGNAISFNNGLVTFNTDMANTPSNPTLVNGANNDVSTLQTNVLYVTAPTGAWNITGFANGANGKEITVINLTGQVATLIENSGSSAAGNKISNYGAGNVTPWFAVRLRYLSFQGLWFVVSKY